MLTIYIIFGVISATLITLNIGWITFQFKKYKLNKSKTSKGKQTKTNVNDKTVKGRFWIAIVSKKQTWVLLVLNLLLISAMIVTYIAMSWFSIYG